MRRTPWFVFGLALLVLAGLTLHGPPTGAQQPEQTYTINWWTVDSGGGTFSTGGGYSLGGTAGQPDAGVLAGGGYTLGSGFWKGGAPPVPGYRIYLPLLVRGG